MKKSLFPILFSAMAIAATAESSTPAFSIVFDQLPYVEGMLFVSVSDVDEAILLDAVDVQSDSVAIPICLCNYFGKQLSVQAFQDLNDNSQLDFDNYGRPTEPCLQTTITPSPDVNVYPLNLIEY